MTPKTSMVRKLPRYESERKPPSSERRNTVPMKLVTRFAALDKGKCISLKTYVIKLFPTAAIAIISKACRPAHIHTTNQFKITWLQKRLTWTEPTIRNMLWSIRGYTYRRIPRTNRAALVPPCLSCLHGRPRKSTPRASDDSSYMCSPLLASSDKS